MNLWDGIGGSFSDFPPGLTEMFQQQQAQQQLQGAAYYNTLTRPLQVFVQQLNPLLLLCEEDV